MNEDQFYKNMDDKSREAADHFSMPFNEDAWQKMDQLLDKDKRRRRLAFWWWFAPLLLLFIAAGTFFIVKNNSKKDRQIIAQTETTAKPKVNGSNASEDNTISKKEDINEPKNNAATILNDPLNNKTADKISVEQSKNSSSKNDILEEHNSGNISKRNTTSGNKNKAKNSTGTSITGKQKSAVILKNIVANKKMQSNYRNLNSNFNTSSKGNQQFAIANSLVVNKAASNKTTAQTLIDKSNETAVAINNLSSSSKLAITGSTIIKKEDSITIAKIKIEKTDSLTKNDDVAKKDTTKQKKSFRKWDFSILAAADISTVKFKQADKISTGVGIGIAYNLSSKFSISTGVVIAKKLYAADSTDYKNAYKPSSHYLIKNIQANCTVIDIPVNLQYRFKQTKNASWFVIGGLSTYLMQKENYNYDYDYYGRDVKWAYNYSNENKHFFSVVNLAVAYRRNLGNNIGLQLSPYFKAPIGGVGQGRVNLYSGGIQVSLHLLK